MRTSGVSFFGVSIAVLLCLLLAPCARSEDEGGEIEPVKVAVLGLGNMGCAAAMRLSGTNIQVSVWNRSPNRCPQLPANVSRASTAEAACKSADIVLLMLSNANATNAVLQTVDHRTMSDVLAIVNLNSASSVEAKELEEAYGTYAYISGVMLADPSGLSPILAPSEAHPVFQQLPGLHSRR